MPLRSIKAFKEGAAHETERIARCGLLANIGALFHLGHAGLFNAQPLRKHLPQSPSTAESVPRHLSKHLIALAVDSVEDSIIR